MSTTTRSRPAWLVPVLVAGAVLLAVVLALTQPWLLFIDEVADEELPTIAAVEDAEETADVDEAAADDATADGVDETAVDDPGDEATGDTEPVEEQDAPASMDEQDDAMEEAIEENAPPEPSGPVVLASGEFISRDHATSGAVAIVRLEDGSRVLTIEGLRTDNGPDLFVYLDDTPADGPEGEFDDGVSLGVLRANIGDLVYEIPDDLDLEGITSVGIWCDRFSSLFGAADLVRA